MRLSLFCRLWPEQPGATALTARTLPLCIPPHLYGPIAPLPKPRVLPPRGLLSDDALAAPIFSRKCDGIWGTAVRFRVFDERFLLLNEPDLVNEVFVTKQQSFRKGEDLGGRAGFSWKQPFGERGHRTSAST